MKTSVLIVSAVALLGASGCEPRLPAVAGELARSQTEPSPETPSLVQRRFVDARWDTVWARGGADDVELLNPGQVRAWDEGVVLFDHGDLAVKRFDAEGRVVWRWGRRGQGPDEFTRVRDLVVGPANRVHVLDHGNGRIVVLDGSGRRVRSVPLAGLPFADRFVPLAGDRWILITEAPDGPLVMIDERGRILSRHPFPWERFGEMSMLQTQGNVASDGETWSYLFSPGDGWFAFRRTAGLSGRHPFVEATEFPRIEERTVGNRRETRVVGGRRCSACSASLIDSTLWVHFGGAGEEHHRILDRYDWRTGEYHDSVLLPGRVHEAVVGPGRVYALRADSYPVLTALSPDRVP